jgi:hypothetical protein
MINFIKKKENKLLIIYTFTYISLILAPNNQGVMPSSYSIIPLSYFFILSIPLFFILFLFKKYLSVSVNSIIYTSLLILIFDFIKIKYDLFSFTSVLISLGINYQYIDFIKEHFILFFIVFFFIFIVTNYRFVILGLISKYIIIFFFPFILIFFMHYIIHYYNDLKFYYKISNEFNEKKFVTKKKVIVLFDELDHKVLKLEIDNLPSFKKLLNNSIEYSNVIAPGLETFDVIPNLINLKSNNVSLKSNLQLKKNSNYLNLINEINNNKQNLFSILNEDNKKLLILSYFHKLCKHFNKYYGECFEHKYYKKPSYRGLIKNSEILDTHIKNYELIFKIFDYFLNNNSLNSAFLHIQIPHTPYFFNPDKNNYEFLDSNNSKINEKGYLGGLILADNYLKYIMQNQKKYKFDLIVISDHGLRSDYKNIKSVENINYDKLNGRSSLIIKKYNVYKNEIVTNKVKLEEVIRDYLK